MKKQMNADPWDQLRRGIGCPLDSRRADAADNWDLVSRLSVSSLYLTKNQTYRGHCVLVLDVRHAVRPDQLSAEEWGAFCADLYKAETAVVRVTEPDHINVASLGNVVPHLHWHIVPRYRADPRWGGPIWPEEIETTLAPEEHERLLRGLREALAKQELG
jgi:diadenosine tetraphosphate (Ap4A) HIT family hydrolase